MRRNTRTGFDAKTGDGRGERMDLAIELKLAADDTDAPAGTIEGYGSVFNLLDQGGDIMLPGAFKKSLGEWKKRKALPPMLWQHSSDQPIGVWTELAEDEKGLMVRGELILDVPLAAATHALIKKGAIGGLSIGYRTQESEIDRTTGVRRLKRVDLWEVSLVTFPMMPEARVASVKGGTIDFNPRELEEALREGGLSQKDAVTAVAILRKSLRGDPGDPEQVARDGAAALLMSMRKLSEQIRG